MSAKPSSTDCGAQSALACRQRGKWCRDCCPRGYAETARLSGNWIEAAKPAKPARAKA